MRGGVGRAFGFAIRELTRRAREVLLGGQPAGGRGRGGGGGRGRGEQEGGLGGGARGRGDQQGGRGSGGARGRGDQQGGRGGARGRISGRDSGGGGGGRHTGGASGETKHGYGFEEASALERLRRRLPDRDQMERLATQMERVDRLASFPERVGSLRTKLVELLFAAGMTVTAGYTKLTGEVKERYGKIKEKVSAVKDKLLETASPRSSPTKGKGPGPLDFSA